MRRFRFGCEDWQQAAKSIEVEAGKSRLTLRCAGEATLCAMSEGKAFPVAFIENEEVTLDLNLPCVMEFVVTGEPIWFKTPSIDQTNVRATDDIFTTLDRPAPLSPEMLAIERLMRRNAIERENDRAAIERLNRRLERARKTEAEVSGEVLEERGDESGEGRRAASGKDREGIRSGSAKGEDQMGEKPKRGKADSEKPKPENSGDGVEAELDDAS